MPNNNFFKPAYTPTQGSSNQKIPVLRFNNPDATPTPLGRIHGDAPYKKEYFEMNPNQLVTSDTMPAIERTISEKQTGVHNLGDLVTKSIKLAPTVLNQAIVGEILGGTLESIGSLLDIPKMIDRLNGTNDAFKQNLLEEFGSSIKDWTREVTPIHLSDHAINDLAMDDLGWWANLSPSIASSLSMMLPSMGVSALARMGIRGAKTIGALGAESVVASELLGGTKLAKGLSSMNGLGDAISAVRMNPALGMSNAVRQVENAARLAGKTSKGAFISDIFLPALASRSMDSAREATARYNQYYNEYKEKFKNESNGEEKARTLAAEAAHNGYIESYGNILFDIVEWSVLNKLMRPVDKTLSDKVADIAYKNNNFDLKGTRSLIDNIWKGRLANYGKTSLSEGFDETFMDFSMNDGKRRAEIDKGLIADDGSSFVERIIKHHTSDAKNWESFIGGALGGLVMGGFGDVSGFIRNKYFAKGEHKLITNLANNFAERMKEADNSLKLAQQARAKGNDLLADLHERKIISDLVQRAAIDGTLDLDVDRYEQIAKMTPEQRKDIDFLDVQDSEGNQLEFKAQDFVDKLKIAQKIYKNEIGKIRTGKDIDRAIGFEIASLKLNHALIQRDIDKQQGVDITHDTIDETTATLVDSLGVTARAYYDKLANNRRANRLNQFQSESLAVTNANIQIELDNIQSKIDDLEQEYNDVDTQSEKDIIRSQIKSYNALMTIKQSSIDNNNARIEFYKSELEKENNILKTFEDTLPDDFKHKDRIKDIEEDYNSKHAIIGRNETLVKQLRGLQLGIEADLNKLQTKEGYAEYESNFNARIESLNELSLNKFKLDIESLDNKNDIEAAMKEYVANHTLSSEQLSKIQNIVDSRLSNIDEETSQEEAINNSTSTSNVETITSPETLSEWISFLNQRRNTEKKSIKERKLINKATNVANTLTNKIFKIKTKVDDNKYVYNSFNDITNDDITKVYTKTKEEAENTINQKYDELIANKRKELSLKPITPEGAANKAEISETLLPTGEGKNESTEELLTPITISTNSRNESFIEGDKVYLIGKTGKTLKNQLDVRSVDADGFVVLVNSKGVERYATIEYITKTPIVSKAKSINKKSSQFQSQLINAILEHDSKITIDADHIYHTTDENGNVISNEYSASQLLKTPYSNKPKTSNTPAIKVGQRIDELVRDYFINGKAKSADYYELNEIQYEAIIKHLAKLNKHFKSKGYKVLAQGIKLFDVESRVAGELDLLLIDKDNNVIIIDTKTKSINTNGHHSLFTEDALNHVAFHGYVAQLNVYAALFKKQFGIDVNELALLPFGVNYTNNVSKKDGVEIKVIEPLYIDENDIIIAEQYNRNVDNNDSIPSFVTYDGSLIRFNPNTDVLNSSSIVSDKSILEVLNPTNSDILNPVVVNNTITFDDNNITHTEVTNNFKTLVQAIELAIANNPNDKLVLESLLQLIEGNFYLDRTTGEVVVNQSMLPIMAASNYGTKDGQFNIVQAVIDMYQSHSNVLNRAFNTSLVDGKSIVVSLLNGQTLDNYLLKTVVLLNNILEQEIAIFQANQLNNHNVGFIGNTPDLVVNASKAIIFDIKKLLNYTVNNQLKYFSANQYKLQLIQRLMELKQRIHLDSNVTISVPEIYQLIKEAQINANEFIDIDELMPLLLELPNIVKSIKEDIYSRMTNLVNNEKRKLTDSNIQFDNVEKAFIKTDEDGTKSKVDWSDSNMEKIFNIYNNLNNSIYYKINTVTKGNQTITTSESFDENRIIKILEDYEQVNNILNDTLFVDLNPELAYTDSANEHKQLPIDSVYNIITNIAVNDNVTLLLQDNGDIHVQYLDLDSNSHTIGVIPNISKSIKGFKISNDKNEYVGFSKINDSNALIKVLFGEDNNGEVIKQLVELQKQRLIANAKNKSDKEINAAKNKVRDIIKSIVNNQSSNTIEGKIQLVLDMFSTLNMSQTEAKQYANGNDKVSMERRYGSDSINNLLDILFFNTHSGYIDSYVPTSENIIDRINYFNKISAINHTKYSTLHANFKGNSVLQGAIEGISKPSILIQNNKEARQTLLESIVPTQLSKKDPKRINIINKRGSQFRDGWTGEDVTTMLAETAKSLRDKEDGYYVLIQSTNNQLTPFPLRANTLEKSYMVDNTTHKADNKSEQGKKAIQHIASAISEIIHATYDSTSQNPVGTRSEEIRYLYQELVSNNPDEANARIKDTNSNIQDILNKYKLRNIIICDNNNQGDLSYPYFHTFAANSPASTTIENIIQFTTIENSKKVYHKLVVNHNTVNYYRVDSNKNENLVEQLKDLRSITPSSAPSKIIDFTKNDADKVLNDLLTSTVGGLLRQTFFNKRSNFKIGFGIDSSTNEELNSFVDPITNKTYSQFENDDLDNPALRYALETNSLYNNIDYVGIEDEYDSEITTPTSNLDIFGAAKVKFNISVDNVTKIKKGNLRQSPIKHIRAIAKNQNLAFNTVFSGIDEINKVIDENINKNGNTIKETHTGISQFEGNENAIASTSYTKHANGDITFHYSYTDNLYQNLNKNQMVDNAIVSLLHEHVHKLILSIGEFSAIDDVSKIEIIKKHNEDVRQFIESFKTSFKDYLYENKAGTEFKTDNINKLKQLTGFDGEQLNTFLEGIYKVIIAGCDKADKSLANANGKFTANMISQELYAYMTDPFVMKMFSLINAVDGYEYKRESSESFLDRLVDFIINIYNKLVKLLPDTYTFGKIEKENYLKAANDMLSDLYHKFENVTKEDIENSNAQVEESITNTTSETVETFDLTDEQSSESEDFTNWGEDEEEYVHSLNPDKNNSIFVNSAISQYTKEIKDNSNFSIC